MKIIGDKRIFAYQWELTDHGNVGYWGHFCFWISGLQVGDYEELTTLSISLFHLTDFLKQADKRIYVDSELVSKEELFYEMCGKYFDIEYKGDTITTFAHFRDTFWLELIGGDSIGGIGLMLLNEPNSNRQRFIWQYYNTNEVEESFLPPHYFDDISQKFILKLSEDIAAMK